MFFRENNKPPFNHSCEDNSTNKRPISASLVSTLLIIIATSTLIGLAQGNPYIYLGGTEPPADAEPPLIAILSPNNQTYISGNVLLKINVTAAEPKNTSSIFSMLLLRVYYKGDWQQSETCVFKYDSKTKSYSCDTNLTDIPEGEHNITVTASGAGQCFGGSMSRYSFKIIGSTSVFFTVNATAPTFSVLSPKNKTYPTSEVFLDLLVSENCSEVSYILDGQQRIITGGNVSLSGLSSGAHTLTAYAVYEGGNAAVPQTVKFAIAEPVTPTPTLTSIPSLDPIQTSSPRQPQTSTSTPTNSPPPSPTPTCSPSSTSLQETAEEPSETTGPTPYKELTYGTNMLPLQVGLVALILVIVLGILVLFGKYHRKKELGMMM